MKRTTDMCAKWHTCLAVTGLGLSQSLVCMTGSGFVPTMMYIGVPGAEGPAGTLTGCPPPTRIVPETIIAPLTAMPSLSTVAAPLTDTCNFPMRCKTSPNVETIVSSDAGPRILTPTVGCPATTLHARWSVTAIFAAWRTAIIWVASTVPSASIPSDSTSTVFPANLLRSSDIFSCCSSVKLRGAMIASNLILSNRSDSATSFRPAMSSSLSFRLDSKSCRCNSAILRPSSEIFSLFRIAACCDPKIPRPARIVMIVRATYPLFHRLKDRAKLSVSALRDWISDTWSPFDLACFAMYLCIGALITTVAYRTTATRK